MRFTALIVDVALRPTNAHRQHLPLHQPPTRRTKLLRIKRLLHIRQKIRRLARLVENKVRLLVRKPLMLERLRRRRARGGVDGQTRADKVLRGVGHVLPILLGLELVVARDDGLHLELLGVAVERRVPREEEVGDDAHCPDVDGLAVPR